MAVMRSSDFRSEVEPIYNHVFDGMYREKPEQWPMVFREETGIPRSTHEEPVLFGFGAAQVKPTGTAITYDEGGEAYTARYVYETYGLGFGVTEELVEDAEHIHIGKRYSEYLAISMRHTKELVAANYLNFGFTALTSGGSQVGDGVTLFNTAHPLASGATASNTFTVPANLSEAGLEQFLINIAKFQNQRGLPMDLMAEKLVIPPDQEFVAERLFASVLRVGTTNNDINALKNLGRFPGGFLVMTRLTSATAFFIITDAPEGLKFLDRRPIRRATEGDFQTGNFQYKATMRFAVGGTDWAGVFGTQGL